MFKQQDSKDPKSTEDNHFKTIGNSSNLIHNPQFLKYNCNS